MFLYYARLRLFHLSIAHVKYESDSQDMGIDVSLGERSLGTVWLGYEHSESKHEHKPKKLRGGAFAAPATGRYTHTYDLFGFHLNIEMALQDEHTLTFGIEGERGQTDYAIECHDQEYTFDASTGSLNLPGITEEGNCIHDQ